MTILNLKKGVNILFATLILCGATMLCSCESETEIEENETQKENIIKYLESSHSPKLIAESDIADAFEKDPEFYQIFGDFAFLYIKDYYNQARESQPIIKSGSKVLINFSMYEFAGKAIEPGTLPFYTNIPLYESLYDQAGLNTELWNFSPMELVIDRSTTLSALHQGLKGCHEGDTIEIYATRNMGYGNAVIGLAEQGASIVIYCTILSVEN